MTVGAYPTPGESIGPYRVGRRIGGGGMGVVFEALDESLNRAVALKVISPHLAENPDFRARFTREAQAQASLDSPHIVHVYGHGEDDGRLWIASQLVPDGDLGTMLARYGAPPIALALDILAEVATGLADAHAAGLVHRDIKPANVLLRRREGAYTAYLADFGIARQVDSDRTSTSQAVVGTPSYMAPELHTGGTAGVRSDIYSMGCLLWALLSGKAPYAGTTDYQIVTAHLEQPIPQLPADTAVATGANAILQRAMAKDAAERYESAAAMRDELRSLIAAHAQAAAPPSAPPAPPLAAAPESPPVPPELETASTSARRVGLVVGLLLVALLAAAGAGYALWRSDDSPGANSPDPSPTQSPSESPTASGTGYQVQEGDEEKAVASFAAALDDQLGIDPEQAACLSTAVIDQAGLQRLVDIGMFDAQMKYHDVDLADHPDLRNTMTAAALTCTAASPSG